MEKSVGPFLITKQGILIYYYLAIGVNRTLFASLKTQVMEEATPALHRGRVM